MRRSAHVRRIVNSRSVTPRSLQAIELGVAPGRDAGVAGALGGAERATNSALKGGPLAGSNGSSVGSTDVDVGFVGD